MPYLATNLLYFKAVKPFNTNYSFFKAVKTIQYKLQFLDYAPSSDISTLTFSYHSVLTTTTYPDKAL